MALMKQLQFLPKSKEKEREQIYNFRSYKFTTKNLKKPIYIPLPITVKNNYKECYSR